MFKKILFLFWITAIALSACGTLNVYLEQTPTPFPTSIPSSTPTLANLKVYSNSKYGFSLEYPAGLTIKEANGGDSVDIGEIIHIQLSDRNPLECRGDCPVVENKDSAKVASFAMTKVTGYIGSVGGNIPQQYLMYILKRDKQYYVFTLYALGFHAQVNDATKLWPLEEEDILLFNQTMQTFKFTN
jgi:hypothetical protein